MLHFILLDPMYLISDIFPRLLDGKFHLIQVISKLIYLIPLYEFFGLITRKKFLKSCACSICAFIPLARYLSCCSNSLPQCPYPFLIFFRGLGVLSWLWLLTPIPVMIFGITFYEDSCAFLLQTNTLAMPWSPTTLLVEMT